MSSLDLERNFLVIHPELYLRRLTARMTMGIGKGFLQGVEQSQFDDTRAMIGGKQRDSRFYLTVFPFRVGKRNCISPAFTSTNRRGEPGREAGSVTPLRESFP